MPLLISVSNKPIQLDQSFLDVPKFAETPFGGMTGAVLLLRTFATTNCAIHRATGGPQAQHTPPLLAWCQLRAAVNSFSNPPRQQYPVSFPAGRRRAMSSRSSPAKAAAGRGGADDGVTFAESEDAARRNADPDSVAFVTGANRGIGLEVTRQLLARSRGERALGVPA